MHELGLAYNIAEIIKDHKEKSSLKSINKVTVIVGELSGTSLEALKMGLDLTSQEFSFLNQTQFILEKEEGEATCKKCQHKFVLKYPYFQCPKCKSLDIKIEKGQDLYIKELEGETD